MSFDKLKKLILDDLKKGIHKDKIDITKDVDALINEVDRVSRKNLKIKKLKLYY